MEEENEMEERWEKRVNDFLTNIVSISLLGLGRYNTPRVQKGEERRTKEKRRRRKQGEDPGPHL